MGFGNRRTRTQQVLEFSEAKDSCEAALPVFHPTESMTALMKSEDDEDDRNHEAYHVLLLCGSPSDPVSLAHICTIRYPNISTPLNDVCG
ncbi:uncharacterized [Tachysurus ichikawai]